MSINQILLREALSQLNEWDFSLTKRKLQEADYAGWTKERADKAEKDYKRYLALVKASGGFQMVPNEDIDRFWHEHILDTKRYCDDCFSLFGGFLHHYPYFGMNGDTDHQNWIEATKISNQMWTESFGEILYHVDSEKEYLMEVIGAQKCPQRCPSSQVISIDTLYPREG
jgi:hypothetical protein